MQRITVASELESSHTAQFSPKGFSSAREFSAQDAILEHRFVVLQAAAGYGKTRLLKKLIVENEGVLLDGAQDLIQSLKAAFGPVENSLVDIAGLIDVARKYMGKPLTLGIDNAHMLSNAELTDLVGAFLQENAEGTSLDRLIFASRKPLNQVLAKPLAQGAGYILPARALRLSKLHLQDGAANASARWEDMSLERSVAATGGWPIHLLNLMRNHDLADPEAAGAAARALADYVKQQVIDVLSADCQEFVLYSAPSGVLDPESCERRFGLDRTRDFTDECLSLGLVEFGTSENTQSVVGTWLPALTEASIRIVLSSSHDDGAQRLAQIAQSMKQVAPGAAFKLAARIGDIDGAYQIIVQTWLNRLTTGDGYAVLKDAEWLFQRRIPTYELLMIQACALDTQGDSIGATLKVAQAAKARNDSAGDERNTLKIALYSPLFLEDSEQKLAEAVETAWEHLNAPTTESFLAPSELFVVGWAESRLRRNPLRALELLDSSALGASAENNPKLTWVAQSNAILVRSFMGRFAEAEEMFSCLGTAKSETTSWARYDAGIIQTAMGMKHYWSNNLTQALDSLENVDQEDARWEGYRGLAVVYRALTVAALGERGALARVQVLLGRFPQSERHGVPWGAYRSLGLAVIAEQLNKPDLARKYLNLLRTSTCVPVTHALASDVFRRLGFHDAARGMIRGLASQSMPNYARVQVLVTSAALAWGSKDRSSANSILEKALDFAWDERIRRPFLVADPALQELLQAHASVSVSHSEWVADLAQEAGLSLSHRAAHLGTLTERETDILSFLCTDKTAEEIGAAVHLSANTIRTHQRSIYRKLGVRTRRDAVRAWIHMTR